MSQVGRPERLAVGLVGSQLALGHRGDRHRLLCQTVEELAAGAGSATVETERELIQVVVQMRRTNGSLMSTQQPALQQGGHPMAMGQRVLDEEKISPQQVRVA